MNPVLRHLVGIVFGVAVISVSLLAETSANASRPTVAGATPSIDSPTDAGESPPNAENLDALYGTVVLDSFAITTPRYSAIMTKEERMRLNLHWNLIFDLGGFAFDDFRFVNTPARSPQRKNAVAFPTTVFVRREILRFAGVTPDRLFLAMPDCTLPGGGGRYAQRDSAGVVLRGVGATNSNALVLLDGVPLNDPIGGGVQWFVLPRVSLARVEVVPAGGATAWGNGALGGVIQFFTLPAKGALATEQGIPNDDGPPDPNLNKQVVRGVGAWSVAAGGHDTIGTDLVASLPTVHGVVQVIGQAYSSAGDSLVAPEKRGSIDTAAWSHQSMLAARWRLSLMKNVELLGTVRGFENSQGDGSPYQQGSSWGTFTSVSVTGNQIAGLVWNGTAYAQRGSFAGSFSAINTARTSETPLIQDVATPSTALGGSLTGVWGAVGKVRTTAGLDFRGVQGEAKQNVAFQNGDFTQQLSSGGKQNVVGLFLLREQPLGAAFHATAGVRLDKWKESGGHARAIDRATGAVLRDDRAAKIDDTDVSPSLGLVWQLPKNWRLRMTGQHSYRRPTLSERYRTLGRQSVVTEANPALLTEHNTSVEVSAEYSIYKSYAAKEEGQLREKARLATFEVSAFSNDLCDMIGDLTIPPATGTFPGLNGLPAGYILRQRFNLDQARVRGVRFSAEWRPNTLWSFETGVVCNDAVVRRVGFAPGLAGNQLAHVPGCVATLNATLRPNAKISLSARLRYTSRQFDDQENALRLGAATTLDLIGTYALTERVEIYFTAENMGNVRIETSRSSDGVAYLGASRVLMTGIRLKW